MDGPWCNKWERATKSLLSFASFLNCTEIIDILALYHFLTRSPSNKQKVELISNKTHPCLIQYVQGVRCHSLTFLSGARTRECLAFFHFCF